MWLYLIIFLIPLVLLVSGKQKTNKNAQQLAVYLTFLALLVGISDMLGGYDRYIYGEVFDSIADVTTVHGNYLDNYAFNFYGTEVGYSLLNVLISYITANRYIFILIITVIVYTLLFFSIRKYTANYPFALILFLGLWFFFSFTYLRQVLGATIAWLGIQYITDRKLWRFLLVWIIAFLMHNSAIVFLPMYFVPIRKFNKTTVLWVMAGLLVLGISPLPNMLFEAYGESAIAERANEYDSAGAFRIEYFLEAAFFLYFIFIKYNDIPNEKKHIVLLNMALVFCAILLFFIRSENGGRLSWYYMMGIISTLTYLATDKKRISGYALLLIGVSFLLYMRIVLLWGVLLTPYKTFLTDGTRKGDFIYQKYEYDFDYANDKMYRSPIRLWE
ncbi:EpsG family protein [Prevotella sp. KH2C16]|uniref:EpsG family protein n=1 Tax=Prevotella sp. KH2C16 TaxID=1855325 RepID=UPI0008F4534E|nr:EpsG family protein [Prevotella sp. KH2C16]SFG53578.1 EpsG family protein [Prevotella sp. KH2C16]